MAVGKEAPISNICAEAAVCRKALTEAVIELTETIASLPVTTIKRRLKDAVIVMPKGFVNGEEHEIAAAASADTAECKADEKHL